MQNKTVDKLAEELNLLSSQLLGLFNRIIRKSIQYFNRVAEKYVESTMLTKESVNGEVKLNPLGGQSLHEELESAAKVRFSHNLLSNSHLYKYMKFIFIILYRIL